MELVIAVVIIVLVISLAVAVIEQIDSTTVVSEWRVLGMFAATRGLGIVMFVVGIIINLMGYALRGRRSVFSRGSSGSLETLIKRCGSRWLKRGPVSLTTARLLRQRTLER